MRIIPLLPSFLVPLSGCAILAMGAAVDGCSASGSGHAVGGSTFDAAQFPDGSFSDAGPLPDPKRAFAFDSTRLPLDFGKGLSTRAPANAPSASVFSARYGLKRRLSETRPIVSTDDILIVPGSGQLHLLWRGFDLLQFPSGETVKDVQPAVLGDGTLVTLTQDHRIVWIRDAEKRAELALGATASEAPAVVGTDVVVVPTSSGVVWAREGVSLHHAALPGPALGTPLVLRDGSVVVACQDNHIYWLKDGATVDSVSYLGGALAVQMVRLSTDVVLAFADTQAIHLADGSVKRTVGLAMGIGKRGAPVVLNGDAVVIHDGRSGMHWFNTSSEPKVTEGLYGSLSTPGVYLDGTVVVSPGQDQGVLWLKDGQVRATWPRPAPGGLSGSPAVLSDGTVAVYSAPDETMYWLAPVTR